MTNPSVPARVRPEAVQEHLDSWIVLHREGLKTGLRIIFGLIWAIDGALKFQPGLVGLFPQMVANAGQNQPAWLGGWFAFWSAQASAQPAVWVYGTGALELALAFSLLFGFLRKVAYGGGFVLSLLIWAVPEGFGGPYGPGSTDIGTGIVYALVFVFLMALNATYGPSRYSLDALIERRWPGWARVAEIRGPWSRSNAPGSAASTTGVDRA